MFSDTALKEWDAITSKYPVRRSALIPILHKAQYEKGFISEDIMEYVADYIGMNPAEVYEVATFYTMFNLKPIGRYHVQVCRNLSCSLRGALSVIDYLKEILKIEIGQTTSDELFTLSVAECLASCGTAPMMQINDDYYENLTFEKIDGILEDLRNKAK